MKRALKLVLALTLILTIFAGCGANKKASSTIKVGASVTPHAEILNVAKEILAEKGITLEVVEFTDYVQPNTNVENGQLDANYFQHVQYLQQFNKDNGTHMV